MADCDFITWCQLKLLIFRHLYWQPCHRIVFQINIDNVTFFLLSSVLAYMHVAILVTCNNVHFSE